MLYGVPLSLLVSGFFFPIGVLIYWVTNNLWTFGQQFYILRKMPPPGSPAALAKAAADKPAVDDAHPGTEAGRQAGPHQARPPADVAGTVARRRRRRRRSSRPATDGRRPSDGRRQQRRRPPARPGTGTPAGLRRTGQAQAPLTRRRRRPGPTPAGPPPTTGYARAPHRSGRTPVSAPQQPTDTAATRDHLRDALSPRPTRAPTTRADLPDADAPVTTPSRRRDADAARARVDDRRRTTDDDEDATRTATTCSSARATSPATTSSACSTSSTSTATSTSTSRATAPRSRSSAAGWTTWSARTAPPWTRSRS